MDDIIQKLIEFDRQCVEKVELAKKKKAEAQSSMMSQKSTIYSEYIDSQQDQVEKHKQDLLNKNKEEAQLQENEFHKSMENMEDLLKDSFDDIKEINSIDGVRLTFNDDSWVLVRPSGTEDYIRITLESKDSTKAQAIKETCVKIIKENI